MNKEIAQVFLSMGFAISCDEDGDMQLELAQDSILPLGDAENMLHNEVARARRSVRRENRRNKRMMRKALYRLPKQPQDPLYWASMRLN